MSEGTTKTRTETTVENLENVMAVVELLRGCGYESVLVDVPTIYLSEDEFLERFSEQVVKLEEHPGFSIWNGSIGGVRVSAFCKAEPSSCVKEVTLP